MLQCSELEHRSLAGNPVVKDASRYSDALNFKYVYITKTFGLIKQI